LNIFQFPAIRGFLIRQDYTPRTKRDAAFAARRHRQLANRQDGQFKARAQSNEEK
jgi:hypothetical protein